VRIGRHGPYDFLIDTGAERTVLARGLAERLGLAPSGRATLMGVAGSIAVDLVDVAEVRLGSRTFFDLSAPLLEGSHIGADGIIGLDGLQNQRVLIDFRRNLIAVDDAKALGGNRGYEIVVRARRRGDQLIMTNAVVDGVKTDVIIDTGAQNSIGNRALQRALARKRLAEQTKLTSVTGQQILADIVYARRIRLGNLDLTQMPVAFADAPPFLRLGLHDKPALESGLEPEILDALASGRRPPNMSEDEDTVYDFCIELEQNHSVSDATYERMVARFGERGVAEATLIQGEYTIMSMFMNVARTPLEPGTLPPLKSFPR
jgi:predicted aspartyl protease